jgi:D-cysteine desulfhydrase family pyridoxal phosphate-dependent enzyme
MIDLNDIPRIRINFLPTPLTEMKRLSGLLGGPRIFIKRDDLTGVALGGNKTRKLEFLLGEALSQNCDSVITCGGMQSNLCRQTAGAAAAAGLGCHLALGGEAPPYADSNLLLDYLLGATIHWCGEYSKGELLPEIVAKLRSGGLRPYVIPYGGSNTVGALGFAAAISELKEQLIDQNTRLDYLFIPSSSGGTHAGMAVGVSINSLPTKIIGVGIDRGSQGEPAYEIELAMLANEIADRLKLTTNYTPDDFVMKYEYFGEGYEVVNDSIREAVQLVARYEGILLDPIYTGRAMAGLIDMIRKGDLTSDNTVLLWHTGGIPAIFRFAKELNA